MADRRLREASEERSSTSNAASDVEIRVHGIGDHGDWSELGSPELVVDGGELIGHDRRVRGAPDVALPPMNVDHALRLVNWSRTSRRSAGFLWYLGLPYTLLNAAQAMAPSASRRYVWWAEAATGLVLTLTTYVWSVAIVETILRGCLPSPSTSARSGIWVAVGTGAALLASMVARHVLRRQARTPLPLFAGHLALVCSAAILTIWIAPAQHSTEKDVPRLFFTDIPTNTGLRHFWDPVTVTSIGAVALVCVVVLVDKCLRRRWTVASAGSALTLVSSIVLLISVASAVRLFLDNGLAYLQRHSVLAHEYRGPNAPYGGRVMLSALTADSAPRDDFVLDLFPVIGITLVFTLSVIAFLFLIPDSFRVAWWFVPLVRRRHKADRARGIHRLITAAAPDRLRWVAPVAALCWAGLNVWLFGLFEYGPGWAWQVLVVGVQVLSGIVFLLVIAGRRFSKVGQALGMLADLVGFWPVKAHPLAGASYRECVVTGITDEITRARTGTVVLVGHSQGSVLAAWAVRHLEEYDETAEPHSGVNKNAIPRERLVIVTCGSPLDSLYVKFFPAYFDAEFFEMLQRRSRAWGNFWRATDPIATNLSKRGASDVAIEDQEPSGVPLGHGDYWVEPQQADYIKAAIDTGR